MPIKLHNTKSTTFDLHHKSQLYSAQNNSINMQEIRNIIGDDVPPLGSWRLREPDPFTEDWNTLDQEWSGFTAISSSKTETQPDVMDANTIAIQQVDDPLLDCALAEFVPMSTDYFDYSLYKNTFSFSSSPGMPQTCSSGSLSITSPDTSMTRPSTLNPRATSQTFISPSSQPPSSPQSETYNCNACSKCFNKRHYLNRHMKLHTKPIACTVPECKHRTAKSRDMKRHLVAKHPEHDFARPLLATPAVRCPVQGCTFVQEGVRRKDNLRRHFRNKHPRILP